MEPQGFLGDYSVLTPGAEGEAVLRYVNTGADWAKYDKVLVDPVTVWGSARNRDIMVAVANVVPFAMATSGAYEYITGEPTCQGETAAKAKVTDAETGELLAATVDK